MTVAELAASSGVDRHLAGLLAADPAFDLWIIDGERPERLAELLEAGRTEGVRLARPGSLSRSTASRSMLAVPAAIATGGAAKPDDVRRQLAQALHVGGAQRPGQGAEQPGLVAARHEALELGCAELRQESTAGLQSGVDHAAVGAGLGGDGRQLEGRERAGSCARRRRRSP